MNNIVIVSQGTGKYLFSVPDNVSLREGDRVKCSTKRGITDGVAFADSAWVDENISQLIGKLTGAKFPLKSVVGKMEYQPFEKAEGKPSNKYEGMSNHELDREMCLRGMCNARNDGRRKHDCLFADSYCHDVTDADRAEVIKYLLAEDAAADPKPEDKPMVLLLETAAQRGLNKGDLAGAMNCARSTMYRKLDSPETLTLGEALNFGRKLNIPIDELRQSIQY